MRLAREGWPFILLAWTVALTMSGLALSMGAVWWYIAVVTVVVAVWVVAFFRDPRRAGPRGDGFAIAPADGQVVSVAEVNEPLYFGGAARRVSIFMNVFNVHENRQTTFA